MGLFDMLPEDEKRTKYPEEFRQYEYDAFYSTPPNGSFSGAFFKNVAGCEGVLQGIFVSACLRSISSGAASHGKQFRLLFPATSPGHGHRPACLGYDHCSHPTYFASRRFARSL